MVMHMLDRPLAELGTLKTGAELADMVKPVKAQPRLLVLAAGKDPVLAKACVKALVSIDVKHASSRSA
jgi:hypothetical protein